MYFQHYYQDADVVGQHVNQWLDASPPEPFFLFVHYMDPHDPYFEIPYNGNGVARVMDPNPAPSRVDELRLELTAQGLPSSGRIGFENFDRTAFGATEFLEKVNYRRALEGEIARTISTIAEVTFYGRDQAGNEVSATGMLSVNFGDFGDPQ